MAGCCSPVTISGCRFSRIGTNVLECMDCVVGLSGLTNDLMEDFVALIRSRYKVDGEC
jgi:hypothetical protein